MNQDISLHANPDPAGHFDALFEKSLDAVVGMDMDGRIIAWNASATELFGWSAGEVLGRQMSETIVPPQHVKAHEKGLDHYRRTGEGPVLNNRVQITGLRRDGREFPVELSIVPIRVGHDRVLYGFIRSREDEERINAEREMRAREAEILAAISAAHLENMDTDAFVRLCLERVCQVAGWAVGHFYRFDNPEAPRFLVPSGVWFISDERYRDAAKITNDYTFTKGEGLPGRVWQSETAQVIDDILDDPEFSRREGFLRIGLTKGFAFPLRNCGTLSGVMEFFGPGSARSEQDLIRFADLIGSHVELALQRKTEHDMRDLLRRELSHRIGNSLAVLGSLFRRCAEMSDSVADLRQRFEPRLRAVGHAHKMVASNEGTQSDLSQIVRMAVDLLPESDRVTIEGPLTRLSTRLVLPITLILHELVTNTLKYGAWQDDGELSVRWQVDEARKLRLTWREAPAKPPDASEGEGYGSVLMQAMAENTMGGRLTRDLDRSAYTVRLEVPLE